MPSSYYYEALEQSRRHHASEKTFAGKLMRPHAGYIKEIIQRLGCRSVLDYGCGKGEQYLWRNEFAGATIPVGMTIEEFWDVPVRKYDPAYPPFASEPEGQFDMVICTHTLGAIPTEDLGWAIDRLYQFSRKAIYVAEMLQPVKKRIFSHPERHPFNWSVERWVAALKRDTHHEVTLAIRNKAAQDGRIVHHRLRQA